MSEALTRRGARLAQRSGRRADGRDGECLFDPQEIETRVVFLVGRLRHFEEDHPNYRRGSFAVDDNALELGALLEDGVPAHSFASTRVRTFGRQAGDIRGSEHAR